jgi:UDP-glucuronate 4-epimerase
MRIFLTGAAGFIGFHTAKALLARGHSVAAIDEVNAYYDPALKHARLDQLTALNGFRFAKGDIADAETLAAAADNHKYDVILHLAAQAGVRHALEDPAAYTRSNLVGQQNILEFARKTLGLGQLIYASSSSVYGNDTKAPFSETARADKPVSYYGATKRAGELLSHSYAELYGLKQTGLRFFTVYGPWGRPDMAYWSFTDAILKGKPIPVFGGGKLRRDFTYIDDIVAGVLGVLDRPPVASEPSAAAGAPPVRVLNIGNHRSELVSTLVAELEQALGRTAVVRLVSRPATDVEETFASIEAISAVTGFAPATSLHEGIPRFVAWFRAWHGLND